MKNMMYVVMVTLLLSGCSSTGTLGLVTKSSADPGAYLRNPTAFKEIGRAEGESCRMLLLGVLPGGNGTMPAAVDDALAKAGGDALINVSVSTSLYGFIPIYNVFSYSCTNVKGIAIKFDK